MKAGRTILVGVMLARGTALLVSTTTRSSAAAVGI
jgi:hypothetical protein